MYAQRLGSRAGALNRFADLAAAGVPLAFGSDAPVTPLGPWAAVRAAVHPSDPSAALDAGAAFAAHTIGGWRAARRDGGLLTIGASATFAVWQTDADDVATLVAAGAENPVCLATVRSGVTIHDMGALSLAAG